MNNCGLFVSISTCIALWWLIIHADKPPIEELHQFLEFQLPRQWAPMYGDLPLGLRHRKQASPSLQFTFLGPRLYVNTMQVISSVAAHKNSDIIMLKISILPVISLLGFLSCRNPNDSGKKRRKWWMPNVKGCQNF